MLGKLLKYDFRALGRVMLPLQGGVLIAGVLGCFLVNFSYRSLTNSISSSYSRYAASETLPLESILYATASMFATLFFAAVFASMWVTLFLVARHLYKSFLKDEGYLTFTLPVSPNQHMLSKTISGVLWCLINVVILTGIIILLTLVGFSDGGIFNSGVLEFYRDVAMELSTAEGFFFIIELLLLGILLIIGGVLQVYFSLIMGGSFARTYKVLAGIGIYVACGVVVQTLLSFVAFGTLLTLDAMSYTFFSDASWVMSLQAVIIPMFIVGIVIVVVCYLLSKHLIAARLNLD